MLDIVGTLLAGFLSGLFFFAGLRFSVDKLLASKYAGLWALGGFVIRMGVSMLVLYFASGSDALRWLIGLAGMLAARTLVIRLTRQKEAGHATKS